MQADQYDENPAGDQVGNMAGSVLTGLVPHATWLQVHKAKAQEKRRK